ncbi:thermonuclease family protein [Cyanobium sp. ATX 6F1]|uniref:thermonuclease family protein n=1 Tax=Cyanobium sp. ATX 6F1 TaxID=2823702 RepID=UPI0020CCA73D|nr:thermonuclease family protein [Cyanobium sp. ATX 6F1]MCP9916550.1 thermonuclease family protein [Cyanobium sp. ATX 6F1]
MPLLLAAQGSAQAAVPLSVDYSVSRVGAKVLSVVDGDSLMVAVQGRRLKLRLACIDAPELAQPPWGVASRAALRALLPPGSPVLLTPLGTDRYGRTVAKLLSERGNVNWILVRRGQALVYRQKLSRCDAKAFLSEERQAQRQGLGVWGPPRLPIAAWERRWCRRQGGGC